MKRSLFLLPLFFFASVAQAHAAASIIVGWIDNSTNETGFKIERKLGIAPVTGYAQITTVGANIVTYADTNLAYVTAYCYRIRAFNTAGDSGYTNEICATTKPDPLPASPSGLTATPQ